MSPPNGGDCKEILPKMATKIQVKDLEWIAQIYIFISVVFSDILYISPLFRGRFPIWLIFLRWVGSATNQLYNIYTDAGLFLVESLGPLSEVESDRGTFLIFPRPTV